MSHQDSDHDEACEHCAKLVAQAKEHVSFLIEHRTEPLEFLATANSSSFRHAFLILNECSYSMDMNQLDDAIEKLVKIRNRSRS